MTRQDSTSHEDNDPEQFFLCEARLGDVGYFLVWHTADRDSFWRDQHGRLLVETDEQRLHKRVESLGIRLEPEPPAQYDFDRIDRWCARPESSSVDCNAFLVHWNFLEDLAASLPEQQSPYQSASKNATDVYSKLFFGSNLPAVTPVGEQYIPSWTEDELGELRDVLAAGIELLKTDMDAAVNY